MRGSRGLLPADCGAPAVRVSSRPIMPAPTLCIFDLDGTLYRTASSFVPTMRRIYEEFGVKTPPDDVIMSMVGETYTTFIEWLIPQGFPDDVDRLGERVSEIEFASIETDGELFPDVEATLRELKKRGCRIALCTNGDRRYASFVLDRFEIAGLFDALATNDDDRRTKLEMVAELIREAQPARTFVIGDRYHDVQAGRANGCIVVGVAYGYGEPEELRAADHVIESFHELRALVALRELGG